MYSDVVLGVGHDHFEEILETHKDQNGYTLDTDLTADDWAELIKRYKARVKEETGEDFPQDPHEQLWGAIGAVFGSWMNARAITYRRLHNIPESWGTAVNVQAMVFGNMGDTSATGVAFTRNPSTGEKRALRRVPHQRAGRGRGRRHPHAAGDHRGRARGVGLRQAVDGTGDAATPSRELTRIYQSLEKHYRDMQDLEFTVEKGKLWMLQTRSGKRTAKAALRIAVELANEGLITKEEAVTRVDPAALDQLLHPTIDPKAERKVIATGLPASPGAASGEIVFSSDEAETLKAQGKQGDPGARRDLAGGHSRHARRRRHPDHARRHDLARRGRRARHGQALRLRRRLAARRLCGADDDAPPARRSRRATSSPSTARPARCSPAACRCCEPALSGEFATLMGWADKVRKLKVRANADTPNDARVALKFGAEGIGLCRTEHMFFDADRIRRGARDDPRRRREGPPRRARQAAADAARRFHRAVRDHAGAAGHDPAARSAAARVPAAHRRGDRRGRGGDEAPSRASSKDRAAELHEFNPMLGFRGCRLAIAYPEIAEMQARAIFEAAVEAGKRTGKPVVPEVMVPLIATKAEFDLVKARIDAMARGGRQGDRREDRLPGRHHDRAAARLPAWPARSPRPPSSSRSAPTT